MPPKLKIEWIQTSTDGLSTGTKMSSIRKNTYDELISLRDYRGPVVTVECKGCRRSAELDRKKLVKQYGASLTFCCCARHKASFKVGRQVWRFVWAFLNRDLGPFASKSVTSSRSIVADFVKMLRVAERRLPKLEPTIMLATTKRLGELI